MAATEAEEIVILSVFTVRVEEAAGYAGLDTVAGGRLATSLIQTPTDVNVLTREFLDDLGALSFYEAAIFTNNSNVADPSEGRDFGNSLTFRGLGGGENTRNFFSYGTSIEPYIIERVEASRGPNAILYGDSNSGGQASVTTKQANRKRTGRVELKVDNLSSFQASVDINVPISDKWEVRINGFTLNRESPIDTIFNDRRGGFLTTNYRPWKGMKIRLEGESTGARYNYYKPFRDQSSQWDGVTTVSG